MASAALDYGAPDGGAEDAAMAEYANNPIVDPGEVHLQDVSMDAEMQEWEQNYQGEEAEYEDKRRQKLDELLATKKSSKFYALPVDVAVEAGARRGVEPQTAAIDDDELLGIEDDYRTSPPDMPGTIGKGLDIRYNALHITGLPITQCSTSRLFAFITHFGAQPLGLEWINDQSCNVVFSNASAARIAIDHLCPPSDGIIPLPTQDDLERAAQVKRLHESGEDLQAAESFEWTDPFMESILIPRKMHRVPARLYNAPERDAAVARKQFAENAKKRTDGQDGEDEHNVPEIYREMEEEDRQRFLNKDPAQTSLSKLRSVLWIRWTVESLDVKGSRSAAQSQWYREHGRDAGKEVVSKVLEVGGSEDRRELLPGNGAAGHGQNRRGHGRGNARGRGQGGSGAAMDELDRELDAWRDRADDAAVGGDPEARRRRRRGSRSAAAMDAVDEEMELDRRDRSASPTRRAGADGSAIKVRGRGRMRAPSAWDNSDDSFSLESRMSPYSEDRDHRQRRRHPQNNLANRLNPINERQQGKSLDQRLAPGRGELLDRLR